MQATATVLVYSDDANTREQVRLAAGRRPAADVPPVEFLECATLPAVLKELDKGGIDVCVLDGEAAPAGGMGVCRQIKDEIFQLPAGAAADRPPAGRLAGHLEPCGRRGDASGGPGGVRRRAGRPAAPQAARVERLSGPRAALGPAGRSLGRRRGLGAAVPRPRAAAVLVPATRALPSRHFSQSRFQSPKPLPKASMVVAAAVDDLDDVALADGVEEPRGVAGATCRCSRG